MPPRRPARAAATHAPTPPRRPARAAAICALALIALTGLVACGQEHEEGEPLREGLAIPLAGVSYNVFITRQLNLADVEDRGYVQDLPDPPTGSAYYGVFLEACNVSDEPLETTDSFRIVDTAGNELEPVELEPTNPFAYEAVTLEPDECIPTDGSVASTGATGGALLIFEVPLESVENRPLELEIVSGFDPAEGQPEELVFELDI